MLSYSALIGAMNAPTQVVLARRVEQHADPDQVVAALRHMWRHTFTGDTTAMLTTLIATDWCYLRPELTAAPHPAAPGQCAVVGVGVTSHAPRRQPVNFCLTEAADVAVDWIYLLDPCTATIAVHTGAGQPAATYPLAG